MNHKFQLFLVLVWMSWTGTAWAVPALTDTCDTFAAGLSMQVNISGNNVLVQDNSAVPATTTHWTWGDGSASIGSPSAHTYPGPGVYYLCMQGTLYMDGDSCIADTCMYITIGDPCASFTAGFTHQVQGSGKSVTVQDNSSMTPTSIYWTWGDGTSSNGSPATHTYANAGSYNVCQYASLKLANGDSCYADTCMKITVVDTCWYNQSHFTYSSNGMKATYNSASSPPADHATWNYGDGSSGSGLNTTHTYSATGTYLVCMTSYWYTVLPDSTIDTCIQSNCIKVKIKSSLSNDDGPSELRKATLENKTFDWQIYPNPSQDYLVITPNQELQTPMQLSVYDLSGRLVRKWEKNETRQIKFYVADLHSGVYLLKLTSESGSQIRKFVKE